MFRQSIAVWTLVAVGAGCDGPTRPSVDLDVTLAVSAPIVRPGEPVDVLITVTNPSARDVVITVNNCPAAFVVFDTRGKIVGPEGAMCALSLQQHRLPSGASYELRSIWRGGGTSSDPNVLTVPLPFGTYRLEGRVGGTSAYGRSQQVAVVVER